MPSVDEIIALFEDRGGSLYGGEPVTQLQHALQSAALAENSGAPAALIVAALLHDVGHLLHDLPDTAPDDGIDDHHESSGGNYLRDIMPDAVIQPIRLHVPAKRYLCAVDPSYASTLSEPSVVSLNLQGGPMDDDEVKAFQAEPFSSDAVRLRRWDDEAKVPDLVTPPLSHFADYLRQVAVTDSL